MTRPPCGVMTCVATTDGGALCSGHEKAVAFAPVDALQPGLPPEILCPRCAASLTHWGHVDWLEERAALTAECCCRCGRNLLQAQAEELADWMEDLGLGWRIGRPAAPPDEEPRLW